MEQTTMTTDTAAVPCKKCGQSCLIRAQIRFDNKTEVSYSCFYCVINAKTPDERALEKWNRENAQ